MLVEPQSRFNGPLIQVVLQGRQKISVDELPTKAVVLSEPCIVELNQRLIALVDKFVTTVDVASVNDAHVDWNLFVVNDLVHHAPICS